MANKIKKDIFERSSNTSQSETPEVNKGKSLSGDETVNSEKAGMSNKVFSEVRGLIEAVKAGKLDARANLKGIDGADKELLDGINEMLDSVIGPLNIIGDFLACVARGDELEIITEEYQGDFNIIRNNINECINVLYSLLNETGRLTAAAIEGRLDVRGNASQFRGGWNQIITGINGTLDAVIGPLNIAAEYVDRISKGDIPAKITDNYKGDFNEIKNNLNACIDGLGGLAESSEILKRMALNDHTCKVEGQYQGVFAETAQAVNMIRDRLLSVVKVNNAIALGEFAHELEEFRKIGKRSEEDRLMPSFIMCMENIQRLVDDAKMQAQAAIEGRLDARIDITQHQGEYRRVVEGINQTLDELIRVMNVSSEYLDKIGRGEMPKKISYDVKGDYNKIKTSMNACVDTMEGLLTETNGLIKATQEGKLDTRGNALAFQGEWSKLVGGINELINAFVGPINVTAEYVDRISKGDIPEKITDNYNGDFNEIKNNLNTCIDAVNLLVADANLLAQAAVEGKLDTRADANKHGGEFGLIIEGVNATLDAVIEPIKEAAEVLTEMEKGNLKVRIQGNYQGDHNLIKDALNGTLNSLLAYVNEISSVLTEMSNGNLNVGITGDYRGDFSAIKDALNMIVSSLNEILGGINLAADQVSNASDQVASSSQMLAQGAAEQSSAIEQLTASITQIAAQTNQNAAYANQANELALNARDNAVDGNTQMKGMLEAMEAINESSGNISKIIKVIDEIAFQTNILALNAAVEAARAGQHGKGFAVVAEEVRNLAARSASAAKETTDMIEGSIKKTEAGTRIAGETANALSKIVEGVSKAAALVGDIAVASNEQATGISQIDKGVEQVSQVIQTNAATAEQSASASEELSNQADLLKKQVSKFILKKREIVHTPNIQSLDPEIILLLEEMLQNRKYMQLNGEENARTSSNGNNLGIPKAKISLSDSEFGRF